MTQLDRFRRSRPVALAAALLVLLGASAARTASAQDADWVALPLPELCRPLPQAPHPPALVDGRHLMFGRASGYQPGGAETELPVPLLLQMLEREARRTGAPIEVYRGAPPLLARGTRVGIEELRAKLADIERSTRALDVELRVGLVPLDAPDAARTFVKRVRSGSPVQLGERTSRAFVAGWNVEVAADSGVAAPEIGTALTGETLHLRAYRVEGGRAVFVEGLLDLAELAALDDFDPQTNDFGLIQQPTLRSTQVAFSGRVAAGERLTVELRGTPQTSPDWTLWIEASTSPDVEDVTGWSLLDLAFVSAPVQPLPPTRPGVGIDDWLLMEPDPAPLEPLPPSAVAAAVDTVRAFSDGGSRAPLHWTTSLLFLPADDADAQREARAFVAAAERARLGVQRVEVRVGELSVTLPISTGRTARVRVGEERTWLVDYGVEIAPETWMPEPVMEPAFDGTCVDLVASESGVACTAWTASSGAAEDVSADRVLLGRLQLPVRTFGGDGTRLGPARESATLLATGAGAGVTLSIVR